MKTKNLIFMSINKSTIKRKKVLIIIGMLSKEDILKNKD